MIPRPISPSREGKTQVIAFLQPNQIEAAQSKATRDNKTNQEIIGEAINAVYALYGLPPVMPLGHERIVRRNKKRSLERAPGKGAQCRNGRKSYGGWFLTEIVAQLNIFASEINLSKQSIIEKGVELITGVAPSPDVGDDWLSQLDREAELAETPEAA